MSSDRFPITRRGILGLMASAALPMPRALAAALEPPLLAPLVYEDMLPALSDRVPREPRVVKLAEMGRQPGRNGGTLRMLIGGSKDIRLMTICGYSRLVGYSPTLEFIPDILESFENVDNRVFTFRLRTGHRWSDGHMLTSEDFRYCWEDVILNKRLRKGGPPSELLVEGQKPRFEVLDQRTVRYTWHGPNPDFLPSLAAPQQLVICMPAHYLRNFHQKYQEPNRLAGLVKEQRVDEWVDLHIKMSNSYRQENPELPVLEPWRNRTRPPAEQFVFERNPFFHRVDENGTQLPYIDKVVLNVSSASIIAAKACTGESDLQATSVDFTDYTYMKDAEKRYPVRVGLWKATRGSKVALLPNQNVSDPVWRALLRDVRFRRALSLAIDRDEINKVSFFGLATPSADTILPDSPLYKPEYAAAYANHDPAAANALLDAIGLANRNDDGIRLLPDGRVAQVVVETAGESTLETDILELVGDHWRDIGISLFVRTSQREVFRSRTMGGQIMMTMWPGLENGVPTAEMNPGQLAPTLDDQLQWPAWGMYYLSRGQKGQAPDLPEAIEQIRLLRTWYQARSDAERTAIWEQMLSNWAEQVFSIGIVNQTRQPVLRSAHLRNVPDTALYGFNPTSLLGVYMPDTFWYSEDTA